MEINVINVSEQVIQRIIRDVIKHELKHFEEKLSQTESNSDKILTREEAMEFLNIASTTLWRWTKEKKVESHGIGSKVFYKLQDLKNALVKTN